MSSGLAAFVCCARFTHVAHIVVGTSLFLLSLSSLISLSLFPGTLLFESTLLFSLPQSDDRTGSLAAASAADQDCALISPQRGCVPDELLAQKGHSGGGVSRASHPPLLLLPTTCRGAAACGRVFRSFLAWVFFRGQQCMGRHWGAACSFASTAADSNLRPLSVSLLSFMRLR